MVNDFTIVADAKPGTGHVLRGENRALKSGIYCFIHRDTLRCYIGSSKNVFVRRKEHLSDASRDSTMCFHRALNKYGISAFDFEVVETCEQDSLLEREKFWIQFYCSASINGFNTRKNPSANYTRVVSEATRQRISAIHRGKFVSAETRLKLRLANLGKKHSNVSKEKMCYKLIGRFPSEATKAKIAASLKGHSVSQATRDKIAAANSGRTLSESARKKLSAASKGRKRSPEAIEKTRIALTGKKLTSEHCAKLSAAKRKYVHPRYKCNQQKESL